MLLAGAILPLLGILSTIGPVAYNFMINLDENLYLDKRAWTIFFNLTHAIIHSYV
jgi:hypothetical protein